MKSHATRRRKDDNRANQMNPNNDAYWQSRGYDGRPDNRDDDDDWDDEDDEMNPDGEASRNLVASPSNLN